MIYKEALYKLKGRQRQERNFSIGGSLGCSGVVTEYNS